MTLHCTVYKDLAPALDPSWRSVRHGWHQPCTSHGRNGGFIVGGLRRWSYSAGHFATSASSRGTLEVLGQYGWRRGHVGRVKGAAGAYAQDTGDAMTQCMLASRVLTGLS